MRKLSSNYIGGFNIELESLIIPTLYVWLNVDK